MNISLVLPQTTNSLTDSINTLLKTYEEQTKQLDWLDEELTRDRTAVEFIRGGKLTGDRKLFTERAALLKTASATALNHLTEFVKEKFLAMAISIDPDGTQAGWKPKPLSLEARNALNGFLIRRLFSFDLLKDEMASVEGKREWLAEAMQGIFHWKEAFPSSSGDTVLSSLLPLTPEVAARSHLSKNISAAVASDVTDGLMTKVDRERISVACDFFLQNFKNNSAFSSFLSRTVQEIEKRERLNNSSNGRKELVAYENLLRFQERFLNEITRHDLNEIEGKVLEGHSHLTFSYGLSTGITQLKKSHFKSQQLRNNLQTLKGDAARLYLVVNDSLVLLREKKQPLPTADLVVVVTAAEAWITRFPVPVKEPSIHGKRSQVNLNRREIDPVSHFPSSPREQKGRGSRRVFAARA